ncbi:hypothetical protein FDI24_gp244 [Acidovorax phage ACP17]|uniref:Uncharacterized protein n=1 Tax=Acidovorax phage ACP17 TaxID=2010329 RepID=A0A218M3A7_9CAUD|nr:hypothetical protein FDI24_gp244 [Acidovorax phage ACP17]ASD50525.1 hypothetical protein [Acidovorax phage ACP17]
MAKFTSLNTQVYIPDNFAPLGKEKKGYFVDLGDRSVHSIHRGGCLKALTPYKGRYKLRPAAGGWLARDVIAKAKRTSKTPRFARV